ncbi:MAG: hypothetical protein KGM15_03940 [Pseudomonadota bacterium]|nr:hypothetical protein [Pseudomonadota bacterium]
MVLPLAIGFSDTSSPAPRLAWDAVTTKLAVFDASTPLTENHVEGMAIDKVVLSAPAPASATSFETTDVLIDAGMSLGVFLNLQSAPYNALDAKGVVLPAAMKLTVADIQQMQLPQ